MSWRSLYHKIDISDIKKGSEKEMIEFTISSLSAFLKHTGLTYRVLSIFPHNLKTNYINRPEYCTPMKINRNMFLWIDMGKIKKVTITVPLLPPHGRHQRVLRLRAHDPRRREGPAGAEGAEIGRAHV